MERRHFIGGAGALLAGGQAQAQRELQNNGTGSTSYTAETVIERVGRHSGEPQIGVGRAAVGRYRTECVVVHV